MKNKYLLLSAILLLAPILGSCKNGEANQDDSIINPETPDIKPETPDEDDNTPDINPETPSDDYKTFIEVDRLCSNVGKSYKENFDNEKTFKIKGTVLVDYAISGNSHFIVLTDGTAILPIMIPANKVTINKYVVGNTYEVEGNPGSYRNTNCLKVLKNPRILDKEQVNLTSLTKRVTISEVYEEAYNIYVEDNDAGILTKLYSFEATFVEKINENLFTVFDGTKHIIIHGDNKVTNGLTENNIYEFIVMPSVHQGKKGCEYVNKKSLNKNDTDVIDKIKSVAIDGNVSQLAKTDRYNDKKSVYPFIFRTNCYISGLEKDEKIYFCLVDDPKTDVCYQKNVNERPATIFIKNHVIKNYNGSYSDLTPYYNDEIKGEFYFYVTNYQSEYHAFQAQIINGLINKIQTQN